MRVDFTDRAADQFDAAVDYILAHNPQSAARIKADILAAVERVGMFPRSGRVQAEEGTRKAVTRQYGYRLLYTVNDLAGVATITAVLHPAQQG